MTRIQPWNEEFFHPLEVLKHEDPSRWLPHSRPAPDDWSVVWERSASGYRLPTEAEWQVACRAGTSAPQYGPLASIAWFDANSGMRLQPTGLKDPNNWGLHDMLGGVWEWCWDPYDPSCTAPTASSGAGAGQIPTGVAEPGCAERLIPQHASTTLAFASPARSRHKSASRPYLSGSSRSRTCCRGEAPQV